jgi:hypothetical protein
MIILRCHRYVPVQCSQHGTGWKKFAAEVSDCVLLPASAQPLPETNNGINETGYRFSRQCHGGR